MAEAKALTVEPTQLNIGQTVSNLDCISTVANDLLDEPIDESSNFNILLVHLRMIERRCGLTCSLDACCKIDGSDAFCAKFHSAEKSFLTSDAAGEHSWIDPPHANIAEFIAHYKLCKAQQPSTTSACILVPRCAVSQLAARGLLEGFQCLYTFPKGSSLSSLQPC